MLLIALWVRSYWWVDAISLAPSHYIGSMQGEFCIDCDYGFVPNYENLLRRVGPVDLLSIWNQDGTVNQFVNMVEVPMWTTLSLFAALATMPWIPWRISWSAACVVAAIAIIANWIEMNNDSWRARLQVTNSTVLSLEAYRGRAALVIRNWPRSGPEPASVLRQLNRGPNAEQKTGIPLGFAFLGRSFGSGVAVVVPYWFLELLAVAAAAAPWLRPPKRFSLHTLLIATTLVAVVLGLIVWLR